MKTQEVIARSRTFSKFEPRENTSLAVREDLADTDMLDDIVLGFIILERMVHRARRKAPLSQGYPGTYITCC